MLRTITIRLILVVMLSMSCFCFPSDRKARAAGQCNGGRHTYVTYCNTRQTDSIQDAKNCINKLPSVTGLAWGCVNAQFGKCKCTADTSYQNWWQKTFEEARENLFNTCANSIEAERYEGNMYLTYTCTS